MDYPIRLYVILYPNTSLIASQLGPEQFAKHYISGSTRHYDGKMMFAEINPTYRHPYFRIDEALKEVHPHEDGRPKATKFISCYRVLEHIKLDVLERLYLTTSEGHCLGLDVGSHQESETESGKLRVYAEIAPLRMLALARHSLEEFGHYITDPNNAKGAPVLFYTQLELEVDEFLSDFDANPMLVSPIPGLHPSKLRDAILELRNKRSKPLKGISLHSTFEKIPYRIVQGGFMFASAGATRFFPLPDLHVIENLNYKFWKHM
jgi:hypothetical protein